MPEDLTGLLTHLIESEVEFVLVGGFAALAHGCSTVTRDVDIAISMDESNLRLLHRSLAAFHPRFRGIHPERKFVESDIHGGGLKNLYLETDIGGLDCLGEVKGIGNYSACLEASVEWEFEGRKLRLLSRDALITSKHAMGRPHDLQTIRELQVIEKLEEEGDG